MEHGSQGEVNFIHESRTGELTLFTFELPGAHLVSQQTQGSAAYALPLPSTGQGALLFSFPLVLNPNGVGCMMHPESCFMKSSYQDFTSLLLPVNVVAPGLLFELEVCA